MDLLLKILGILLLLWWGWTMVKSWRQPVIQDADTERERQIGILIGSLGGDLQDAVHARYAISRLEESLGRKATLHEIAVAIGASVAID